MTRTKFSTTGAAVLMSVGRGGIAQVRVTGVVVDRDMRAFQRWLFRVCETEQVRGCVVDFRRAILAIDWVALLQDPQTASQPLKAVPNALVTNPALTEDAHDLCWRRARQGHMRAAFSDADSATAWAVARAWMPV